MFHPRLRREVQKAEGRAGRWLHPSYPCETRTSLPFASLLQLHKSVRNPKGKGGAPTNLLRLDGNPLESAG